MDFQAPLLSLVVPIVQSQSYVLLSQEPSETKASPANAFDRKQILLYLTFGAVAAATLTHGSLSGVLPVNICWLLAQSAIFVGIYGRTKSWGGGDTGNVVEAVYTLLELATLMACTTMPLSLLWWSNVTINAAVMIAGLSKVTYWAATVALVWNAFPVPHSY